MAVQRIPSTGLALTYAEHIKDGDTGPQMIRLDLLRGKTKELLQELRSGGKAVLSTGKQAAVRYGKDKLPLEVPSEAFPAEVYTRTNKSDQKMYFSGRLSLHLEMARAREDTAKADTALANLRSTLTSMKEEQMQNETATVKSTKHGQLKPVQSRKGQLIGGNLSRPSSPFLGAAFSPGPTSAPLLGSSNPKLKIRAEAMRIPVIHLLASKPMSMKLLIEKTRAPREECEKLLDKVARESMSVAGKKELKDRSYRDLDVWQFPYASTEDREAAIEHAIHAFDRMRVDKTDALWQMLLKPEERGKGKYLSRLNFEKPPAPVKTIDPPATKKGETSDSNSNSNSLAPKKAKVPAKGPEKKALLKDTGLKSRTNSPGPVNRREVDTKAPSATKFKSAERIEDSDEDADLVTVPTKRIGSANKERLDVEKSNSQIRFPSPAPKRQAHKLSTSSSSSSTSENSDSSQARASLKAPVADSVAAKGKSPRPRHGSSPSKPSPLGSSPPANSTDFDSASSTTTKGTSQSSVPSSPESSMPLSKKNQKYSPIVKDRMGAKSEDKTMKRKQDDSSGEPPAKRQQVNGVSSEIAQNATKSSERPQLERKSSESERSSSSDKPGQVRDEVMDKAKRFQAYYKKYKDLHDRINSTPEKDRDAKEMDNLWIMHNRLRDMKKEIWNDWDSVESTA